MSEHTNPPAELRSLEAIREDLLDRHDPYRHRQATSRLVADLRPLVDEVERLREIVNAQKAATKDVRTLIRRARSAEHQVAWLQRRLEGYHHDH